MELKDDTYAPVGHKLILENALVRVWETLLYPGEEHPLHHHTLPYVEVMIEGGSTQWEWADGHISLQDSPPGQVRYYEAGDIHTLKNTAEVRYWSRTVELKTAPYRELINPEDTFYDEDYAQVAQTVLFENDLVRVWEISLDPGQGHPTHHHLLPYVILSVEGGHNQMKWQDGRITRSYEAPGFVLFREPGGIHRLYNTDETKHYWNRLVELKVPAFPLPQLPGQPPQEVLIDTNLQDWRQKSVPGLSEIRLWSHDETGASISLVKFEKGSGIPEAHQHASNQFMYCLSGEYVYTATNLVLKPGSFYWNPQGNVHGPTVAREDSVLVEIYDGPHYPEKPSWYKNDQDAK